MLPVTQSTTETAQNIIQNTLHYCIIGCVYNIPTMQFLTGISRNTQSKSYMLSFTEFVWDFQNNALWDNQSIFLFFTPVHLIRSWSKSMKLISLIQSNPLQKHTYPQCVRDGETSYSRSECLYIIISTDDS